MRQEFSEVFKLRVALAGLVVLTVIAQIVYIVALVGEIDIFARLERGELPTQQELVDSDDFVAGAGGFVFFAAGVSFVLLLIWTFRTYENLLPLRAEDTRFSPGWSLGAWLIPLVNLVMPFLVFQEMWKGSSRQRPEWQRTPADGLIVVWWTLALISMAGFVFASILRDNALEDVSLSGAQNSDWALIGMVIVSAGFALLTIPVTWRIAARQLNTYRHFVETGVYDAPSPGRTRLAAAPVGRVLPSPSPPPPPSDANQRQIRLGELARLADAGLISEEELRERRARILDEL